MQSSYSLRWVARSWFHDPLIIGQSMALGLTPAVTNLTKEPKVSILHIEHTRPLDGSMEALSLTERARLHRFHSLYPANKSYSL